MTPDSPAPKIEPTPVCCDVWSDIAPSLVWFRFEDAPDLLAMPCIETRAGKMRVNYCPSCGAPMRGTIMHVGELRAYPIDSKVWRRVRDGQGGGDGT